MELDKKEGLPNCFGVVKSHFTRNPAQFLPADEMLNFISDNFVQISQDMKQAGDCVLVWSRTAYDTGMVQVDIEKLAERQTGFPYGMVLQHAFVLLEGDWVVHKADPTPETHIEVVTFTQATEPYVGKEGYELTYHRFQRAGNA